MVTDFSKLKVNLNFKIKVKHKTRAPAIKQDKVLTNLIQTKCLYENGKFYVIIPYHVYKQKLRNGVDINEYLSDTITKGNSSSGGWVKTIIKLRSPLTVEGTSAEYMFYRYSLNELPQIDTSNVTRMDNMFSYCTNLTTIPQIDTSSVTNMTYMFGFCKNLTTIPQIDTSSVTNMNFMFNDSTNLTTIPQLNGEKLTAIAGAFSFCKSLENFNGIINLGQEYSTTENANNSNYKLNLSDSTKLTEQSIINILNNLYDIATKGCNTQTVTLGATNLAKLTSTEGQQALASAQSKGWNIS